MSSRTAEFASAILIGVLVGVFAGAYLITMPYAASDDCLTQPTGDTPQGQHWFYRIERGSKRHCWYLRSEADKPSRVASSEKSPKAASRKQDGASQHSVADAHAELRSRARIEDNTSAAAAHPGAIVANAAATAVNAPVADDNGAGSNVLSRWPDPIGLNSSATPQPDTAATTVVADAQQPDSALTAPQMPVAAAPAAPAPADATAVADQQEATPAASNGPKYSGSLQELMVVAFAALALAGLTGHGVYRLAGAGRARRRYNASRRSTDWQGPKKKKKARKARRVEPQPVAMDAESFAPKTKYAPEPAAYTPEPAFAPEPVHDPEPVYEPEPDYAHAQEAHHEPEPEYEPEPDYAPQSEYVPQSEYARRPQFAPQHSYANAAHSEDYEPVSEYAPKPRGRVLDESYESIEQLLIRLAK
jgi:hypothetical protein